MAQPLKLKIVTPDRPVFDGEVNGVEVPGVNGTLGILPGHLPLMTTLRPGALVVETTGGKKDVYVTTLGFAEVLPDQVTILSSTTEHISDIDVKRAEDAAARARENITKYNETITDLNKSGAGLSGDKAEDHARELHSAEAHLDIHSRALERAEARLRVHKSHHK